MVGKKKKKDPPGRDGEGTEVNCRTQQMGFRRGNRHHCFKSGSTEGARLEAGLEMKAGSVQWLSKTGSSLAC